MPTTAWSKRPLGKKRADKGFGRARTGRPVVRPPSIADGGHHTEYDLEPFMYREHDFTPEEAKKRLLPAFRDGMSDGVWSSLIENIEQQGMRLVRSGGGLVVVYNDGRDVIKASDVSNKFSLSRLEKILGPCPLPKSAPAQPPARDLLIQAPTPSSAAV